MNNEAHHFQVLKTVHEKPRMLIVDDDQDILDLLRYNLIKENFDVKTLHESSNVVKVANRFHPNLIILDLIMAPYNGIEVCKMLRANADLNLYIFFLTGNANVYLQDSVYNVGGDEFLEKVTGIKTLISKVRCVLNHNFIIKKRETKLKLGSLELYRGKEVVYYKGKNLKVKKAEFDILFFMVQNPDRWITLSQLTNTLWGSKTFIDENTVKSLVIDLQKKIGDDVVCEKLSGVFLLNHKSLVK